MCCGKSFKKIGLSSLSGNHMILAPEVVQILKRADADDIKAIFGGTVPPEDILLLKEAGISEVFGPGGSLKKIIDFVKSPD
jgi:methylmalonyl-CoA mutase C-terminal domain/subunit